MSPLETSAEKKSLKSVEEAQALFNQLVKENPVDLKNRLKEVLDFLDKQNSSKAEQLHQEVYSTYQELNVSKKLENKPESKPESSSAISSPRVIESLHGGLTAKEWEARYEEEKKRSDKYLEDYLAFREAIKTGNEQFLVELDQMIKEKVDEALAAHKPDIQPELEEARRVVERLEVKYPKIAELIKKEIRGNGPDVSTDAAEQDPQRTQVNKATEPILVTPDFEPSPEEEEFFGETLNDPKAEETPASGVPEFKPATLGEKSSEPWWKRGVNRIRKDRSLPLPPRQDEKPAAGTSSAHDKDKQESHPVKKVETIAPPKVEPAKPKISKPEVKPASSEVTSGSSENDDDFFSNLNLDDLG